MRERMLAGELYIADDPEIGRELDRAQRLTHQINTMDPTDHERRRSSGRTARPLAFRVPMSPPAPLTQTSSTGRPVPESVSVPLAAVLPPA